PATTKAHPITPFLPSPQGTIRAVMIFVDFSDAPAGSLTTQQAADQVLGREHLPGLGKRYAFQRLYHDQSYGKLTIDVDVRSDLGWRRMPKPSSSPDYNFSMTGKDRFNASKNYITDAARLFTPVFGPKLTFAAYTFVYVVPPPTPNIPISPAFNAAPLD